MVSEAMLPRAAVREVEQRLTAAGCPDADFDARELFRLATGRDVRLSDRPLTAEQAAALGQEPVVRSALPALPSPDLLPAHRPAGRSSGQDR
jgi:hypothetical protein